LAGSLEALFLATEDYIAGQGPAISWWVRGQRSFGKRLGLA
jgi:hypothetical protein